MIIITNPVGEFPLGDDWSYSRIVLTLITKNRLELLPVQTALGIGHILWGAIFAKIFGFSMTVLRISVLTLGLVGIWSTYFMFKSLGNRSLISFWSALTIAATPLYFGIANSFMTDISFYTFSVTAYFFLIRYLCRGGYRAFIAGFCLTCLAAITRQVAIIIPIAFSLAYFFHKGFTKQARLHAGIFILIFFSAFWILHLLIKNTASLPVGYSNAFRLFPYFFSSLTSLHNTPFFLLAFVWRISVCLIYLGFFLFPSLLLLLPAQWKLLNPKEKLIAAGITLCHITFLIILNRISGAQFLMPSGINYIYDFGFGPVTITGAEIKPTAPPILWIIVTLFGIIGSGIILSNFLIPFFRFFRNPRKAESFPNAWVWVLCTSSCVLYFLPWSLFGQFDRYFIFYMPIILLLVLSQSGSNPQIYFRLLLPMSAVLILFIGFYSVAGTHDYLNWHRVRWSILRGMMKNNISPMEIDGGYEFNGWYTYYLSQDPMRYSDDIRFRNTANKNFWWVYDDAYILSLKPLPKYHLIQSFPISRWLPPHEGPPILLLQRDKEST